MEPVDVHPKYFSFPKYVTPPCSPQTTRAQPDVIDLGCLLIAKEELQSPQTMRPNFDQPPRHYTTQPNPLELQLITSKYDSLSRSNKQHHNTQSLSPQVQLIFPKTPISGTPISHQPSQNSQTTQPHLVHKLSTSHHLSLPHPSPQYIFPTYTREPVPNEGAQSQKSMSSSDNKTLSSPSTSSPSCNICGDRAGHHLHYGAVACFSCRQFFRRGRPKVNRCVNDTGDCRINKFNRTNCKLCR